MSDIVAQHKEFLQDGYEVFRRITADGRIVYNDVAYVHIMDLCQDVKLRYHLSRRFDVFPGCFKGICTVHKRGCRILEENFAFALYLHYVELVEKLESVQETNSEDNDEMEEELPIEKSEESQDEEQFIDLEEERTEIAALDLITLKAETLRDAVQIRKIEVDSSSYAVPMLPSFKIGAGEYVFLNDILSIFNLREDYALGLIAQSCRVDKYVMIDDDPMMELEDMFNPSAEIGLCFKEARNFQDVDDVVFKEVQASMNLTGSSTLPLHHEQRSEHSISLWKDNLLEQDENMKVISSCLCNLVIVQSLFLITSGRLCNLTIVSSRSFCSWILKMNHSFRGPKEVESLALEECQVLAILLQTYVLQNC